MERNEPTFAPEWLRTSNGSGTGSTGSNKLFLSSFLHSDDYPVSKHTRNRPLLSINDNDVGHPSYSGRNTSSYFRHNSISNGSSHLQSHSGFSKKNTSYYRDKDRSFFCDNDKNVVGDSKNGNKINYSNGNNSLLSGVRVGGNVPKHAFERDFPPLGAQKRQNGLEIGRVPSPGNKTNYSNGNNSLFSGVRVGNNVPEHAFERDFPSLGAQERQNGLEIRRVPSPRSDGCTSALVEVPGAMGSNRINATLPEQNISANLLSMPPSLTASLDMAETVAQRPSCARTPPQLSVETQRVEELVMKQSRQLVPMTPSTTKTSVLGSSEKGKSKIGPQHASFPVSLTSRSVPPFLGKLHVLKPSRELNVVSSTAKDILSPERKVVNSPSGASLSTAGSVPLRTVSNNPNFTTFEKEPSAQSRSRNDFFNLIKKSSGNSPTTLEKANEVIKETQNLLSVDAPSPDTCMLSHSGEECDATQTMICNGEKNSNTNAILHPDEEEAAFLRSLGWKESAEEEEEEGLTEEEINAFYKEYLYLRPSLKSS